MDTVGFEEGSTLTGEETDADGFVADDSEFNIFNTDRRLAAIEQLSDALAPIQQKKSIVYFNSGVTAARRGQPGAAARGHRPRGQGQRVDHSGDTRGLTAVVPGGSASQASGRGGTSDVLGPRRVAAVRQPGGEPGHARRMSDTGGKAFLDTNDFGGVYTKVIADTSAYYCSATRKHQPARDGRFRRIKSGSTTVWPKVEHRNGYYASRIIRQRGSRAAAAGAADDRSLVDRSDGVDVHVVLPTVGRSVLRAGVDRRTGIGDSVRAREPPGSATIDVIGLMRDPQQRPVGRLRDTVKLAVQPTQEVKRKTVQYETGFTLPPGKYPAEGRAAREPERRDRLV